MNDPRPILFLDLATRTGWCEGIPGGEPTYGSTLFAPEGAGRGAVYGGAFKWMAERIQATRPRAIAYEAPLARNAKTAELLMGICGCINAAAYLCRVYDVRRVHVSSVRAYLLDKGAPRAGAEVKHAIIDQCKLRGFHPTNDDEADAIAGWLYTCGLLAPEIAHKTTPLFAPPPAPEAEPNTRKQGEAYDPYRGF